MRELTRKPLSWFRRGTNVRKKQRSESERRALGEGMRDEGQIEPVVARPNGDLIAGYGRLDAALLVGLQDLEVIITDEIEDEGAEMLCAAQENWLRQDLSDVDKIYIVERLRTLYPKWLAKELAEKLHVDPSTITKLLSVSKVIAAVREAFESGAITLSHVYQFSKLDPQQQHQLLPNAVNGATREIIEQEGRKRRDGSAPVIRSSRITISLPSQTKVVLTGRNLSLAEVIECLTECLDSAKRGLKDRLDARTWQSVMRDRAKAVSNAESRYKAARFFLMVGVLELSYSIAVAIACGFPWSMFAAVGAIALRTVKKRGWLWKMGTARWATESDLRKAGMIGGDKGLIVGRIDAPKPSIFQVAPALFNRRVASKVACDWFLRCMFFSKGGQQIRLSKAVHTAIFAPTGAGKGAGIIVPHLFDNPESMVCIDLKGELASITASYREKHFGQRIVLLDPYRVVTQKPDTMNNLDFIERDSPDIIDACRDTGEMLVVRTGNEPEPHWNDGAESIIAGITAEVVDQGVPGFCSLQAVADIVSDPKNFQDVVELTRRSPKEMLARMGGQMAHFKDKELASMLTSANRHLRFLNTPAISESTSTSSFDPSELRNGKMTVYLILPPEHMRAQMGLLRLWIGTLMRSVIRGGLQHA